MKTYFAIGHKEDDSAYGFWFPDVEGCFGAGDSYDEAMKDAAEALRTHIELLAEMGQEVPKPRSIDEIHADGEVQESRADPGSFIIGVPYLARKKVKKRVSFNADESVVNAIERQIAALGVTKTDWWIQAAHQMLGSRVLDEASPPKQRSHGRKRKKQDDGDSDESGCYASM